jgi:F-type H+-transporting ATPase subunit b
MHFDAEFFVALGFMLFVLIMGYLGVHKRIAAELDRRSAQVADELAEARRVRDEAEKLLASYVEKARQAEAEATSIVEQARAEAEAFAQEAAARMQDFVTRRSKQAAAKIALAEAQATAEVRAAAADAAVSAAELVLKETMRGPVSADIIARAIPEAKSRLAVAEQANARLP